MKLFKEAADKLLGAVADKRVKMLGDKVLNLELGIPDSLLPLHDEAATWRKVRGLIGFTLAAG